MIMNQFTCPHYTYQNIIIVSILQIFKESCAYNITNQILKITMNLILSAVIFE